jgi:ubiquinone biosynthesis O-methyltransferase
MLHDKALYCIVCNSKDTDLIYKNHQGFKEGSFHDIYKCNTCNSQFILANEEASVIYEDIYSSENTYGYERYYNYAREIKDKKDPLEFLVMTESTYFPVYEYLKDKHNLSVLEVGCGYGYLSYALHKSGFNVIGIDISSKAIEFAKKNFGSFFYSAEIEDIDEITNEKFNIIIATEVLEHLPKPDKFLLKCLDLLKSNGCIILTTPNKDYFPKNAIWQTDLPPVHIFWITRKGMLLLAKRFGLGVNFINYSKYYPITENKIVKYLLTRRKKTAKPKLNNDGIPIKNYRKTLSITHKLVANLLHRTKLIRCLSNFLYNKFSGSDISLGAVLTKNK